MNPRTKNWNGFTLVELLGVVVIIGLLVGISVPAFNKITASSALNNGSRQFSDQVAMARTYALANGKDVHLLVANKFTGLATNACISYGFVTASSWPPSASTGTNVTYIDKVQYLPAGAVFADVVSASVSTLANLVSFPTSNSVPATQIWSVTINRYGQILPLATPPVFYMVRGFTSNNAANPTTFYPHATGAGTNIITINPITGKAIIAVH